MRDRYTNRKARIEKKFSTEAKKLLIALDPAQYPPESFTLEEGYNGDFCYSEWQVCTVDYWGEADSYDAFYLLHNQLIQQTTDWDGIGRADDAEIAGLEPIDKDPFYSPWRLGAVTRAQIIRHCRQLVKAGVTWQ
ncbi:hypothetical protein NEJ09_002478 [Salmonella enterica]|nr:hypothetical protein [Salmonella enterica]HCM1854120.1 hypothetical protein [Salmonella enterica subsp. arizonae serovar 56:z4,z23:-]EBB1398612.1 hypothetical protein [Salmonella enterica]EDI9914570.1 hypothetical protein [Salmonella enterica]EGA9871974.1 hypothetical protein [Salmonella enterica]